MQFQRRTSFMFPYPEHAMKDVKNRKCRLINFRVVTDIRFYNTSSCTELLPDYRIIVKKNY
jgi:hypothetical protein